jgi:hypothetical protein
LNEAGATTSPQVQREAAHYTSHPVLQEPLGRGRPRLDDLIPSRYALRVGAIDVLVVSDDVVTPPAESMATNAYPAVRAAWLDDMFPVAGRVRLGAERSRGV